MAIQDILAKHGKTLFSMATSDQHSAWQKLRAVVVEITVIALAVSVSIWLHGIGERWTEQRQAKTFLLGLKRDIRSDISQINRIIDTDRARDQAYVYLATLDPGAAPDQKKFNDAYAQTQVETSLIPQIGRYEGFKSSGKLTSIRDDALLEKIMALYQANLQEVRFAEENWNRRHADFRAFQNNAFDGADGQDRRWKLLVTAKGRRLANETTVSKQQYETYQNYAELGNLIARRINDLYPPETERAP
jgi:hypothetical protein